MTLLIQCVTQDYVVAASDRRVTLTDGKGVEDRANKAVFVGSKVVWSYTGLAQLGKQRTDEWLCDFLLEKTVHSDRTTNFGETLGRLADEAERAIAAIRFHKNISADDRARITRLTFLASGFARLSPTATRPSPFIAVVSNFLGATGEWMPTADKAFTASYCDIGTSPLEVMIAGVGLKEQDHNELERMLRACVRRGVGPHAIARVLARAIQAEARTNDAVGANVVCSIVTSRPVPQTGRLNFATLGVPLDPSAPEAERFGSVGWDDASPTWVFLPGPASDGIVYGPAIVIPGRAILAGGVFGPHPLADELEPGGPFPLYE